MRGDEEYYRVRCEVMGEGFVAPLLDPSAGKGCAKVYCLNCLGCLTVLLPAFHPSAEIGEDQAGKKLKG